MLFKCKIQVKCIAGWFLNGIFHFQKISQVKMVQKGLLCQECGSCHIKIKSNSSKSEKMKTQNISIDIR